MIIWAHIGHKFCLRCSNSFSLIALKLLLKEQPLAVKIKFVMLGFKFHSRLNRLRYHLLFIHCTLFYLWYSHIYYLFAPSTCSVVMGRRCGGLIPTLDKQVHILALVWQICLEEIHFCLCLMIDRHHNYWYQLERACKPVKPDITMQYWLDHYWGCSVAVYGIKCTWSSVLLQCMTFNAVKVSWVMEKHRPTSTCTSFGLINRVRMTEVEIHLQIPIQLAMLIAFMPCFPWKWLLCMFSTSAVNWLLALKPYTLHTTWLLRFLFLPNWQRPCCRVIWNPNKFIRSIFWLLSGLYARGGSF